jgi:glycosyltransferase involved in cell wall biosynthesis
VNSETISVVIATRNRVAPLRIALRTMQKQSSFPSEVLIVDSSDESDTRELVQSLTALCAFPLRYIATDVRSAARQRNLGADLASGDLLVFLDDDVRLEPTFLEELRRPFAEDGEGLLAGVSGTIVNQIYTQPKGINRFLLASCLGNFDDCWAGRLVGPAVNFLPQDKPDTVQPVEWLFSTGTAYRREIFLRYRFGEQFSGYSFAEDVDLSARIGRQYRLSNTTRARFEHMDMGQRTHTDWVGLGESMVVNRRSIMIDVLGRKRWTDRLHLFAYEVVYCSISMAVQARFRPQRMSRSALLIWGKLRAFMAVRSQAKSVSPSA